MKNLKVLFAMMAVAMFTFFSANDAQAQTVNVGTLLTGLINVNVGDIEITDVQVVNIEGSEILTDFQINALNNAINNNEIASRNRDILTDFLNNNQVVVGILGGVLYVTQ